VGADAVNAMKLERKLTNQRSLRCRCDLCVASVGPLTKGYGKLWQANYGEATKDFHSRLRSWHAAAAEGRKPSNWYGVHNPETGEVERPLRDDEWPKN
jgi:hypothetical protein